MRLFWRSAAGRLGVAANLVVAVFILVSAALPFTHHNLDCHLKSLTHCRACTVAAGAKAPHAHDAPVQIRLNDAGAVVVRPSTASESLSIADSSGRAPPAIG
jgi:hypothetical protein